MKTRDPVTVFDDLQMECSRSHGRDADTCIFLSGEQNSRGELWFIAEQVVYVVASDTNKVLKTERFPAKEFSAWWAKRRKAGWRFC